MIYVSEPNNIADARKGATCDCANSKWQICVS